MRVASDYAVGEVVTVDIGTIDYDVDGLWVPARIVSVRGQIVTVKYEADGATVVGEFFEDCVRPCPHGRIAEAVRKRHEHRRR